MILLRETLLQRPSVSDLKTLSAEFQSELERLSTWWKTNAVDRQNGGFYGQINLDGRPVVDAPKGLIYIARILWFFSMAALRSGTQSDADMALRARDFLVSHFIDTKHGGVFWEVDARGAPTNTRKQGYAQAFAIYGLAAHAHSSGDEESLEHALALFDTLEARFYDLDHGGYWEAFARDWVEIEDVRLSEKDDDAPKTMNTHLHILEAYTELYRAKPLPRVRKALESLIKLHNRKIFRADIGHLRLFWQADWRDVSRDASFGHDIEASWLLWEAAEVLGDDNVLAQTRQVTLQLAETALAEAMGPDGEMYNERSFSADHIDTTRIWWVQAEALVGFLNAYQLSGNPEFFDRAVGMWAFIKQHVLRDGCEWSWFSSLDADQISPYQAGHWKACYHNGRAMMECLDRLEKL